MDNSITWICLGLMLVLFSSGCVQQGAEPQDNETIEENLSDTEPQTTSSTSTSTVATTTVKPTTTIQTTSTAPPTTLPVVASGRVTVLITNKSFIPQNLTIKVDTYVTWLNNDSSEHQIISDVGFAGKSGGFSRQISDLKSSRLFRGYSYIYRFRRVGNFTYHCNIYPNIRGSITVLP